MRLGVAPNSPSGVRVLAALMLLAVLGLGACADTTTKPAAPTPVQNATAPAPSANPPVPAVAPSIQTAVAPAATPDGVRLFPARATGIAVAPLPRSSGRGELVLHGGGVLTRGVAEAIVARAGPNPRLCLIETADQGRGQTARFFRQFAGVAATVLDLDSGNVAQPAVLAALEDCTAHFFGGGDPKRLSTILRPAGQDSPALAVIRRRFEQDGVLVAGSSAGAMIVGPVTLCECAANSSVQAVLNGKLFRAPGFDFLSAPVLVDAHFFARGLMGRHLFALARDRLPVGVGIDEDGAVLVSGDQRTWRVIGGRRVALLFTPPDVSPDRLENFGLALLAPGDEFDPAKGTVVLSNGRQSVPGSNLSADIRQAGLDFNVGLPITYDFEIFDKTIIVTEKRDFRAPHWLSGSGGDSVLNAKVSVRPAD